MNFELSKIKVTPDGVEAQYIDDFAEYSLAPKKNQIPHPDLKAAIEKLRPFLADSNGLRFYRSMPNLSPKRLEIWNGTEVQKCLDKLDDQVFASVIPSGISLSGDGEGWSVVITGKREIHGTAVAMNSPKINCHNDSFGFAADDLFAVVHEIIDESKKFIIDRKSAQMSIEFEKEEEKAEEPAEV